jgi:hypothetical protein
LSGDGISTIRIFHIIQHAPHAKGENAGRKADNRLCQIMRKSLSILSFNGGMITTPLARSMFFRTADFNCRVNEAIRRLFEILIRYTGQTNTRLTSQGATLDLRLWFYLPGAGATGANATTVRGHDVSGVSRNVPR